jgi:hypothetical protein
MLNKKQDPRREDYPLVLRAIFPFSRWVLIAVKALEASLDDSGGDGRSITQALNSGEDKIGQCLQAPRRYADTDPSICVLIPVANAKGVKHIVEIAVSHVGEGCVQCLASNRSMMMDGSGVGNMQPFLSHDVPRPNARPVPRYPSLVQGHTALRSDEDP